MIDINEISHAIHKSIFDEMFIGWDYDSRGEWYLGNVFYGRQMGHTTQALKLMAYTEGVDFYYINPHYAAINSSIRHYVSSKQLIKALRGTRLKVDTLTCVMVDTTSCDIDDLYELKAVLKCRGHSLVSLICLGEPR